LRKGNANSLGWIVEAGIERETLLKAEE